MRQLQILIKPASSACDLRCRYCFYQDEAKHRQAGNRGRMSLQTARILIDKALGESEECVFGFQGGEPLLAGLEFYEAFTSYAEACKKPGQRIFYTMQTNGMLLDESWMNFFKRKEFLVGISVDGVRRTHDENRIDASGNGTFSQVFENVKKLQGQKIPFHILCVLTAQTAKRIEAVYRFFVRKGFYGQQYIPCLDKLEHEACRGKESYSLTPKLYGEALCRLFDMWFQDVTSGVPVSIRQFENYVLMLQGAQPEACAMYGRCSMQNVIEADGTVYPCDFYALDAYEMGNIRDEDVDFQKLFLQAEAGMREKGVLKNPCQGGAAFFREADRRDERCCSCRWYPLCRGGCRRDCFQNKGRYENYYCLAYQEFFAHAIEHLEWLAAR